MSLPFIVKGEFMSFNKKRLKLLQEQMRQHKIQCLVLPLGYNFRWLFGFLGEQTDRFTVTLIEQEGPPKLIAPEYIKAELSEKIGIDDCIGWQEAENPIDVLTKQISYTSCQSIAFDPRMWFSDVHRIVQNFQKFEYCSIEEIFNSLRSIKDEEEQKLLLKASQKTVDLIISTLMELEVGLTETDVTSIFKEKLKPEKDEKFYLEVSYEENTAKLPSFSLNTKLKKDNVVVIDAGVTIGDYWGDITITSVFGKASSKFKEIYKIVKTANSLAKQAVIENKRACEVDEAARAYITKMGYGKYFTHRTGHGIGLEIHEEPYIVQTNPNPIINGHTFTIEPGIYLPRKFGVRIEDDIIKTEDGILTSIVPREDLLEI